MLKGIAHRLLTDGSITVDLSSEFKRYSAASIARFIENDVDEQVLEDIFHRASVANPSSTRSWTPLSTPKTVTTSRSTAPASSNGPPSTSPPASKASAPSSARCTTSTRSSPPAKPSVRPSATPLQRTHDRRARSGPPMVGRSRPTRGRAMSDSGVRPAGSPLRGQAEEHEHPSAPGREGQLRHAARARRRVHQTRARGATAPRRGHQGRLARTQPLGRRVRTRVLRRSRPGEDAYAAERKFTSKQYFAAVAQLRRYGQHAAYRLADTDPAQYAEIVAINNARNQPLPARD